jgi:RNA polymerase sigma-70 factor (ECF subfamily)
VRRLIAGLPDRCRRIFELRKIEGWSQRAFGVVLGVPDYTLVNDVARGLRLILRAIAEGERLSERALTDMGRDERARDSRGD